MAGGESRARGRGIERRRMQKRTSGGKIREKVTGESLSSYYEEQKGGKKVEIGGKKEWRRCDPSGWWWLSSCSPPSLTGDEEGAGKRERSRCLLLPSVRVEGEWKKQERGMKRGRRNGAQASSALICLDTNLFPRQLLALPCQPSHSSRGIVIPLCYVIDAVPVVTNSNSPSLTIRLSRRTRSVYRVEII